MAMNQSWVSTANAPDTDFPLQNLPYGVVRHDGEIFIAVAIGDEALNLRACAEAGLLAPLSAAAIDACRADVLNPLMALGPDAWSAVRKCTMALLDARRADRSTQDRVKPFLVQRAAVEMLLPAHIGDYTDFYASIDHATRVGKLFRPDNPLLPNYKYVPIGYHGRASSIVVSGSAIRRPSGQIKDGEDPPRQTTSSRLDYELEVGAFIGTGSALGIPIPISQAEEHIFGLCLVNDWSARDIQSWEYQPLGPFLAKSFATTISPWIVPVEALAPYRIPVRERGNGEPAALAYLSSSTEGRDGIDLSLEVLLQTRKMRSAGIAPCRVSQGNLRELYWSLRQLVAHHTSNGCNLRSGDLLATGTVSGPEEGSEGCLLEMKHRATPFRLPGGETRSFLEDGDQVTLRGCASREGLPRIGFGDCAGTILGSNEAR
ncbi:MAG TPA: fumarylacetoacetase [Terracidiphilus sp.]|nr:fumarylacetoacetase [Terracidiphilus sp.]